MSQECSRTNGTRFGVVYKEYFGFDREHLLPARRTVFYKNRNQSQPSDLMSIAINGRDDASIHESSPSSDDRSITIVWLRFDRESIDRERS